jgi:hypothetical protein
MIRLPRLYVPQWGWSVEALCDLSTRKTVYPFALPVLLPAVLVVLLRGLV